MSGMRKRFLSLDEKEQREKLNKEQENELQYAPEEEDTKETGEEAKPTGSGGAGTSKRKIAGEDTIMNRMAQWQYSKEQKEELHKMMALGMTKKRNPCGILSGNGCSKNEGNQTHLPGSQNRQG